MHIKGWAFEKNEEEMRDERFNRYKQLNKDDIEIETVSLGYAHTDYKGKIKNKELSELDILLLCDGGNTCFGGEVNISSDKSSFSATVYTD